MKPSFSLNGASVYKAAINPSGQNRLVGVLRELVARAPLFHPITPSGRKMSVRMTSAGVQGWVSDRAGYRYQPTHPDGAPWPEIPDPVLEIWQRYSGVTVMPDCCLINYYGADARMGLHQDRDEAELHWPVVSVSLGDDALFRVGGATRKGSTESAWLSSGDIVVLHGAARLAFHGIDRLRPGSSSLLRDGGRINLTLRVAGPTGAPTS